MPLVLERPTGYLGYWEYACVMYLSCMRHVSFLHALVLWGAFQLEYSPRGLTLELFPRFIFCNLHKELSYRWHGSIMVFKLWVVKTRSNRLRCRPLGSLAIIH